MRESSLEKTVRQWLWTTYRLKLRKLQDQGESGFPDRSIICCGRIMCIELKSPGGTPSPWQERRAAELIALGVPVLLSDDLETIKSWISRHLQSFGYRIGTNSPLSGS